MVRTFDSFDAVCFTCCFTCFPDGKQVSSRHWLKLCLEPSTALTLLTCIPLHLFVVALGAMSRSLLTGTPSTEYKACETTSSKTLETASTKSDPMWTEATAEQTRYCLFLAQFMQQMNFTGIIVDSYQIGRLLDVSPAFSGLLVGLFMAGGAVGTSMMMLALQAMPNAWKNLRTIVLTCLTMDTMGALIYTMLIHLVVHGETGSAGIYPLALALVRFLWGIGCGVTGQLTGVAIAKTTPPWELPDQMQTLQFWQTLGLGQYTPEK